MIFSVITLYHDCPSDHTSIESVDRIELCTESEASELTNKLNAMHAAIDGGNDYYRTVCIEKESMDLCTVDQLVQRVQQLAIEESDFFDGLCDDEE